MSFVSTNNKSGIGGLTTTTPPITGESGGVTADSVAGSVADPVSYTHLTLPTERGMGNLVGAGALTKKKRVKIRRARK
ncbi:hypothetical protein JM36_23750, partial [Salmonella enterica]